VSQSFDELQVRVGFASETGPRARNEDYLGAYLGTASERATHGVVAALADGIGGAKGGREAAELVVRGFIEAYYALPATSGVRQAGGRALEALSRWCFAQGRSDAALAGMGTTLTALILRGRRAHLVHVGDSRLYRLSGGALARLTEDHVLDRPGLSHVLSRAIGIEEAPRLDYDSLVVLPHDRFLLCSDGVHGVLSDDAIGVILAKRAAPDETARLLVAAAAERGTQDNASALVIDLLGLPATDAESLAATFATLPLGELPRLGEMVDGFVIDELLSDGRYSRLFKATDSFTARRVVLKFPKLRIASEKTYRLAFVREAWVAGRVRSPWLGEIIELPPERQSRLYLAMPLYDGETLEQRLRRDPRVALGDGINLAVKLAKAIAVLHRAGIIHRDIKPENVIIDHAGEPRLIDLGVVRVPRMEDFPADAIPGTPSYMAPELLTGQDGDELSDLFALGVTLYRSFSGAYPFGEIEPFSHPRFVKPVALTRHRPDLPAWLDILIGRAIAPNRADRFGDVLEFALELESNFAVGASEIPRPRRPLYHRNPLLVWQIVSLLLFLALVASIALRRP
jgi:serine/threonine protein phosphatase PrpC